MFMFTYERMLQIRDGIIAKTQSTNFESKMVSLFLDKYSHIWKFGEKVAKEMALAFDRSSRKWVATHNAGELKPIKFAKKPSKYEFVMMVLWAVSKQVSKGNNRFLTIH